MVYPVSYTHLDVYKRQPRDEDPLPVVPPWLHAVLIRRPSRLLIRGALAHLEPPVHTEPRWPDA